MTTIFSRIVAGEVPATIVHQDELVTAFRDRSPIMPTHVLIVPNKPIATVDDVTADDEPMLGHMFAVAAEVARTEGLGGGYRLVVNVGPDGGQEVMHLHMHLLGGGDLGPVLCRH